MLEQDARLTDIMNMNNQLFISLFFSLCIFFFFFPSLSSRQTDLIENLCCWRSGFRFPLAKTEKKRFRVWADYAKHLHNKNRQPISGISLYDVIVNETHKSPNLIDSVEWWLPRRMRSLMFSSRQSLRSFGRCWRSLRGLDNSKRNTKMSKRKSFGGIN